MQRLIMIVGVMMACCSCASLNNFLFGTPEHRAAMAQVQAEATNPIRQFDGSYEMVFRSTIRALVDLGFSIQHSDMVTGLISASLEKEQSYFRTKQKMSVLVDKINNQKIEVKITPSQWDYIQEVNGQKTVRPLAWYEGVNYKMIFDSLQSELIRRQGS